MVFFYNIPFEKLNHMLEYKLKNIGTIYSTQEESYTSKCDSLSNEPIEKREHNINGLKIGEYTGNRIKEVYLNLQQVY